MGYTTEFNGKFSLSKTLTLAQFNYLRAFSQTRRMKRNESMLVGKPDPKRAAVELPLGSDAEFYVGEESDFGQVRSPDVVEYNEPPCTQPGLWCQWTPTDDGNGIEWNGGEKFYDYVEWIKYVNERFLKPWGIGLRGCVAWRGEDFHDAGEILANDGEISVWKKSGIKWDCDKC